jgi:hypothetical protein
VICLTIEAEARPSLAAVLVVVGDLAKIIIKNITMITPIIPKIRPYLALLLLLAIKKPFKNN